jgi:hypothetical protein
MCSYPIRAQRMALISDICIRRATLGLKRTDPRFTRSCRLVPSRCASQRSVSYSIRPRASSVASSSSASSFSVRARTRVSRASFGTALIWNARAIESSGRPSSGEACTVAVPAKLARSKLVVRGITRTDWRMLVSALLCQMTTGRRPVCSRGRKGPRSAHHTSPRLNYGPLGLAHRPTRRAPVRRAPDLLLPHSWLTAQGPSASDQGGEPRSAPHALPA